MKVFFAVKEQCVLLQQMDQHANVLQVNLETHLLEVHVLSINVLLKDHVNHHRFASMDVANINAMELFVVSELNVMEIQVVAFVNHSLLEIPIIFVCRLSPSQLAVPYVVSTLIVNMDHLEVYVSVILEAMETPTKDVDHKKKENANLQLVEKELNVAKDSMSWNVFVHLVIMAIHTSAVMTSMSVRHKSVVNMQFALTHQEVMTAVVARIMLEIHSKCVLLLNEVSVLTLQVASAVKMFPVQVVTNAIEENVKIFVRRSNVVHELHAMVEPVFVLLATMEIQMILKKVAQ